MATAEEKVFDKHGLDNLLATAINMYGLATVLESISSTLQMWAEDRDDGKQDKIAEKIYDISLEVEE